MSKGEVEWSHTAKIKTLYLFFHNPAILILWYKSTNFCSFSKLSFSRSLYTYRENKFALQNCKTLIIAYAILHAKNVQNLIFNLFSQSIFLYCSKLTHQNNHQGMLFKGMLYTIVNFEIFQLTLLLAMLFSHFVSAHNLNESMW